MGWDYGNDDFHDEADAGALREERDAAVARAEELIRMWKPGECPRCGETFIKPHTFDECPTYYDGCNCDVATLVHNIKRAEAAEAQVGALRAALEKALGLILAVGWNSDTSKAFLDEAIEVIGLALAPAGPVDQGPAPATGEPGHGQPGVAKYRKRPVVIEAVQWTDETHEACVRWLTSLRCAFESSTDGAGAYMRFEVRATQGRALIVPGDWIVREPNGDGFYPCRAHDFVATYELVAAGGDKAAPARSAQAEDVGVLREALAAARALVMFSPGECGGCEIARAACNYDEALCAHHAIERSALYGKAFSSLAAPGGPSADPQGRARRTREQHARDEKGEAKS